MSETALIDAVLDRHRRDGTRLVQILRETQEQVGWLSPATLTHIADGVGWPRAMVSGTASFYSFFHTRPRGAIACSGRTTSRTACWAIPT
jgi:[NiFe] hydrogenase diaphorase moiety large subunit